VLSRVDYVYILSNQDVLSNFLIKLRTMEKLRDATLAYLIKKNNGRISDVCLAMKKRGFGAGRWNGVGGKVMPDETIEDAAKRETQEEIGVDIKEMTKVAELSFYFPHNSDWNQMVHVYFSEHWDKDIAESEEMAPKWFSVSDLPYSIMWPDDEFWFPQVLEGKLVRASFIFGENDIIKNKEVKIVEKL
jgi:8-oxo-dGTP pyrophosphatase MutT (NUDIX family)